MERPELMEREGRDQSWSERWTIVWRRKPVLALGRYD